MDDRTTMAEQARGETPRPAQDQPARESESIFGRIRKDPLMLVFVPALIICSLVQCLFDYQPKSAVWRTVVLPIQLVLLPFLLAYYVIALWIVIWIAFTQAP